MSCYDKLRSSICISRTWDKKIPPKEGFLLFLSGTARGCLVLSRGCLVQAVWHSVLSYCSFTSVIMTSQRKAQRLPQRQRVALTLNITISAYFLFKMHISRRYEKNNQVPMLNPDRQISVSGDTMSHPSLGYRLDWYLWHRITLDWDLSVWIQHWYLILLVYLFVWGSICIACKHNADWTVSARTAKHDKDISYDKRLTPLHLKVMGQS